MTNITALRTPYHALGDGDGPHVPEWAQHRAVYRSAGRTLYVVETDRLDAARTDLDALARDGWNVQVDRDGRSASIALTRTAA